MHLYNTQNPQDTFAVSREEPFTSSSRIPVKQSSSPTDYRTTLENQFQRQNMYKEGNRAQRQINQPLLFSIDYILNLAVKEQQAANQQQQQQQSYLSQLAHYQQYHHHHLHQRQQQQQQPLDQQTQPQQKDIHHQHEQAQDCRKKKTRTVFTKPQVMHLESVFRIKKYLTCFERSQLASSMNLSDTQIKIWFQNRRNKFKREHLIPPLTMGSMMWEQQANKDK